MPMRSVFMASDRLDGDVQLAADLLELVLAEAARGRRRRAKTDAGSDEGLLRIEGDAVLVTGDVRAADGMKSDCQRFDEAKLF